MEFHPRKGVIPIGEGKIIHKAIDTVNAISCSWYSSVNKNGIEFSYLEVYSTPQELIDAANVIIDFAHSLEGSE